MRIYRLLPPFLSRKYSQIRRISVRNSWRSRAACCLSWAACAQSCSACMARISTRLVTSATLVVSASTLWFTAATFSVSYWMLLCSISA
ncbi:hypothetical protein [Scytonema sp. NUACC26]|uniref:hypothetical protein n=1 Tax=Scytonema sp. NUACC26 TaxID=3140176 RepID=UPI0038B255A3